MLHTPPNTLLITFLLLPLAFLVLLLLLLAFGTMLVPLSFSLRCRRSRF